ncbi:hypothetical protein ACFSYH_07630 [Populibacterium corticicola]|uniref:Uncharacterized protein n=1 Tax=Populibacterium corticicola TaxID=1812826 RepID=A0ABW5XFE1_9MICO
MPRTSRTLDINIYLDEDDQHYHLDVYSDITQSQIAHHAIVSLELGSYSDLPRALQCRIDQHGINLWFVPSTAPQYVRKLLLEHGVDWNKNPEDEPELTPEQLVHALEFQKLHEPLD